MSLPSRSLSSNRNYEMMNYEMSRGVVESLIFRVRGVNGVEA